MLGDDILPVVAVLGLMGLAMLLVQTRYSAREFQLMAASLFFHVLSTVVQLWLVYDVYNKGDVITYHMKGAEISTVLRQDPIVMGVEVLRMLLQLDYHLPMFPDPPHAATGTLMAICGILQVFLADSLIAVALFLAGASWLGKIALYQAFRERFPPALHDRILVAALLVPSVVFWSGGVVKEGVAIIGVGLLTLGFGRLLDGWSRGHLLMAALGALIVGLMKPHILFAMTLGAGAWLYWRRAAGPEGVRIRPLYLVVASAAAFGLLLGLGEIFPQFALDRLADQAATAQGYALKTDARSTYYVGDPLDRSIAGQLSFMPIALFTALFRPLVFEASNPQMLVNAFESTGFLLLVLYAVVTGSAREVWRTVNRQPFLMFCLVFSLIFGAAVGLVSSNLGTLSRYRMPMVPFFAALTLAISAPQAARVVAPGADAPAPGRRGHPAPQPARWVRPIDRERAATEGRAQK